MTRVPHASQRVLSGSRVAACGARAADRAHAADRIADGVRLHSLRSAFRSALTKREWTEGSNLRIELRWGAGDANKIRTFAKELAPVIDALARETRTIPIVFTVVADPIGSGFAASLAHPGSNITGFSDFSSALGGKWVELLKEIAPRTVRMALLVNPATTSPIELYMSSTQAAALSLAVQASAAPVHAKDEIEGVIAAQARNPGGGRDAGRLQRGKS